MNRVIILGGSGFLGRHLLDYLQTEDTEILAITNKTPVSETAKVKVLTGGISTVNRQLIDSYKPDVIFHCARPTLPRLRKVGRILAAKRAFKFNKKLVNNIESAKHKPKLVFASGSLMYGNSNSAHNEFARLNPTSYAKQYFRGEIPVIDAVKKNNFPVIVLRLPWLLGNGSWFKWFYLENIRKFNSVPAFGDLSNNMEMIDVFDVVRLMKLYAHEINQAGVFNITSGEAVTQADFLKTLKKVFEVDVVDSTKLFPKGLEKEAFEAFTSNIRLTSLHPEIMEKFRFTSLAETVKRIKTEVESA